MSEHDMPAAATNAAATATGAAAPAAAATATGARAAELQAATPPAAGRGFARVTETPLDLAEHVAAVTTSTAGAVATFIGQVRDHDPDAAGRVTGLDYSAHPDAGRIIGEIADRLRAEHPRVTLAVSHRIGHLDVGALALVAAVASAHRALAFAVCEELVEIVKAEVPIWKKQHEVDGSHSWVGLA